jgi:ABC-type cobalamin/Fe3+-siderophores transport system ATPase subunit
MKISNLEFKQFGPFNDARFAFSPGYNAIAGPNGTGKSLVLATIYGLFTAIERGDTFKELPHYRRPGQPGVILANFKTTAAEHAEIQAVFPSDLKSAPTFNIKSGVLEKGYVLAATSPLHPNDVNGLCVHIAATRGKVSQQQFAQLRPDQWRRHLTGHRFAALKSLLHLIDHEYPSDAAAVKYNLQKYFQADLTFDRSRAMMSSTQLGTDVRTHGRIHDLISMASGFAEVLFIIVETVMLKNSIILIDEPELHLHPKAQRQMTDYLYHLTTEAGGNNQVIVATHSLPMFYGHAKGRVWNLHDDNNNVEADLIIEDDVPKEMYNAAMLALGYDEDTFIKAFNFHKRHNMVEAHPIMRHMIIKDDWSSRGSALSQEQEERRRKAKDKK